MLYNNQQGDPTPIQGGPQNNQATTALVLSIFGVLSTFCGAIYMGILFGVLGTVLAFLSKKKQGFTGHAVAALTLGIISVVFSLLLFGMFLWVYDLAGSPIHGPGFNEMIQKYLEQYKNMKPQ